MTMIVTDNNKNIKLTVVDRFGHWVVHLRNETSTYVYVLCVGVHVRSATTESR